MFAWDGVIDIIKVKVWHSKIFFIWTYPVSNGYAAYIKFDASKNIAILLIMLPMKKNSTIFGHAK